MSTCKRCGRPIAGNIGDPIISVSLGVFHHACMRAHFVELAARERDEAVARAARRAEQARRNFHGGAAAAEEPSS